MSFIFSNNAQTTLSSSITSGQTSIAVTDGSAFGSPSGGDLEAIALFEDTKFEIFHASTRSGNTFSVVTRGEEGTTKQSFSAGAIVRSVVSKEVLEAMVQGTLQDPVLIGSGATAAGGAGCTSVGPSADTAGTEGTAYGQNARAAGNYSIAVGSEPHAQGINSIAQGRYANVDSDCDYGISIGDDSSVNNNSDYGIAHGQDADVNGAANGQAYGFGARARVASTWNMAGIPIIRKDDGETASEAHYRFAGASAVIVSKELDFKTAGTDASVLTIKTGSNWVLKAVYIQGTSCSGVTLQPQITIGTTSAATDILAATASTGITANLMWSRLTEFTAGTAPSADIYISVTTNATGTTFLGRVIIEMINMETE